MFKKKFHWYSFGFKTQGGSANMYKGLASKNITLTVIEDARTWICTEQGHENPVLIAATYLGYMTKEEFNA